MAYNTFIQQCNNSYCGATVYLQVDQFGIFPRCLIFPVVLDFWCFVTSFVLLFITAPVRKTEKGVRVALLYLFFLSFLT